jgi:radical SAM protein with 4Fe4S-binding SPASM domain
MLVRQDKNSFIRRRNGYGYIINQMTFYDRYYDEVGTILLLTLSREPQEVEDIVKNHLLPKFEDVDYNTLYSDFVEFLKDLERNLFIVTGNTIEELNQKEMNFSYSNGNMKTQSSDFTQKTPYLVEEDSQSFSLDSEQNRPNLQSIQFELTSRCNERCIHCYIPNTKKDDGSDMPIEKVKNVIDQFSDMGGSHVTLSGGEVFIYPNFTEILTYCREKDMRISILSNLIAMRNEHIAEIKKANVSIIQTSLYSMIPEHHDFITKIKGSFIRTKNAIEKLVAADIPVQISCPVMKANAKDYKDVLLYAKSLNIKAQTDYIMMAQSDFDNKNLVNRLSLKETEELLRDIIEFDISYRKETLMKRPKSYIKLNKKQFEKFKRLPLCGAGINTCCIAENGDVYPCSGWQGMVIGNVMNKSLSEIWENSEKLKELRGITQSDFQQCLSCEALDFCSRCLVRNFNESNGDMYKVPKHFCDVAFLNKRLVEEYMGKNCLSL